ncbi:MAG: S1 RNA-binding domain-containing protein, partial [Saprospiraceae bacterium]|nr:S1 RNA-binding domain-containing protein [Saprospiraceae bacterium]
GLPTLLDITKELEKPGLDPRGKASVVKFSNDINSIDDLYEGMILPGIVNNITKFGAFVDIGIKESGLVHISEITNKFINDVSEVLHLNQEVNVKVINIDAQRKRVGLSIKQAN